MNEMFDGPLFLVGMPRSGTKLLRSLLNGHPNISIAMGETTFLPYLVKRWATFGDLSDRECFARFYKRVRSVPYMQSRAVRSSVIGRDEWHRACSAYDAAAVFEALLRHDTGNPAGSGVIWGDKSPGYLVQMPMLKSLYPKAKFIHLVRDARDYCLSMRKAFGKNIYRSAQRWNDEVASARRFGRSISGYCELRYEDLLGNTEEQLATLCRFLGVDFVQQMVELKKPTENIAETKGQATVVRSNTGKFRTAFSENQIHTIERVTCDCMRDFGYSVSQELEATRIPDWRMNLYRLGDGANVLIKGVGRLGIRRAIRKYSKGFVTSPHRVD